MICSDGSCRGTVELQHPQYFHSILSIKFNIMSPSFFNYFFLFVHYTVLKFNVGSHLLAYEKDKMFLSEIHNSIHAVLEYCVS